MFQIQITSTSVSSTDSSDEEITDSHPTTSTKHSYNWEQIDAFIIPQEHSELFLLLTTAHPELPDTFKLFISKMMIQAIRVSVPNRNHILDRYAILNLCYS